MDRRQVIDTLRQHQAELQAAGIVHLRLFGSVARGEAHPSDIDLMADFEESARLTLVTLGRLESRLTDMLGATVELSSEAWMKPPVRTRATREAVLAF